MARPPLAGLVVPGATEIRIERPGLLTQQISYRAPGPPYGWYFAIIRAMSRDGWSGPVDTRRGIRDTPETHWRIWPLWLIYVEEEITLQGEADRAHITVRRRIIVPWQHFLR